MRRGLIFAAVAGLSAVLSFNAVAEETTEQEFVPHRITLKGPAASFVESMEGKPEEGAAHIIPEDGQLTLQGFDHEAFHEAYKRAAEERYISPEERARLILQWMRQNKFSDLGTSVSHDLFYRFNVDFVDSVTFEPLPPPMTAEEQEWLDEHMEILEIAFPNTFGQTSEPSADN